MSQTTILKLDKDDPQKEMEFDIKCRLAMPVEERLKHWLEWNLEMLAFVKKQSHESVKSPQIVKRP